MTFHEPTPPAPIEEPPVREPSRNVLRQPMGAALLVVVIAAFGGAAVAHFLWPTNSTTSTPSAGLFGGNGGSSSGGSSSGGGFFPQYGSGYSGAGAASAATNSVASRIDPGLVDVDTVTATGEAAGTGMVVTSGGEVITNNHVISGATQISAYDVGNGKTYTAHVLGYDRTQDVAVIQLDGASGLHTVPLGDSSTVRVGAAVVTIGNAGGTGGTPSDASGAVAKLNQSITAGDAYEAGNTEQLKGVIEINGALEPGDSGGPLVISGKVVGMDTAASATFSFQSSNAGEGFAIPINEVLTISKQIVSGQGTSLIHVGQTALIGVYVSSKSNCVDANDNPIGSGAGVAGALVCPTLDAPAGVVAGSPAAASGLGAYDTITGLGGAAVTSAQSLLAVMDRHHPGDRVLLKWVDKSGHAHSATVRLAAAPAPD